MKDKWYLLYDGQSTDGRGNAKYVVIVTDEALTKVSHVGDFN